MTVIDFLRKQFRSHTLRSGLTAMTAAAIVILSPAQAQEEQNGFWIAPGVLVNKEDAAVVLMSPDGRVESIRISDGGVRWRSNDAAKPVALRGANLIAQSEDGGSSSVLSLASLDRRTGALRGQDSVDLGGIVDTSIDQKLGEYFALESESYRTRSGEIFWRYYKRRIGGPEETPPPPIERSGQLIVDQNADISPTPAGFSRASGRPPYVKPRMARVTPESPARTVAVINMETGQRFRRDGALVDGVVGVPGTGDGITSGGGDVLVAAPPPEGGLYITEGRAGDEFPPTRWLPGEQFGHSSDENHILSSAFTGDIEASEHYRWRIYERRTFELVADFVARMSFTPFVVSGDRVIYLRQPFEQREGRRGMRAFPLAVVARSASTGEIVWTRPVRNTSATATPVE